MFIFHIIRSYANSAWESTYFTKLKTLHYQQKQAERVISNKNLLSYSMP